MHGIHLLPRALRFTLVALAGAAALAVLMLVPLISAAHAAPSIPISAGACLNHGLPFLGYAVTALVAAGVATFALPHLLRYRVLAVGLLAIGLLAIVQAASAAEGSTLVDVTPLAESGIEIVGGILVSVLGWIGTMLFKKLKLDRIIAEAAANRMFHDGLQRGAVLFKDLIHDEFFAEGKSPLTIDVHSDSVAAIANRMIDLSPDLLKRLRVTDDQLKQLSAEAIIIHAAATPVSGPSSAFVDAVKAQVLGLAEAASPQPVTA